MKDDDKRRLNVAPPAELATQARKEIALADASLGVVFKVKDLEHARSNEVLMFCVEQLKAGKTYNQLRIMLGCGPASHDRNWRTIRALLIEMILPASEEEALQADATHSSFMLRKMEEFLEKVEKRSADMKGREEEAQFLKLELEAMKAVMEKYNKRTEHYLKVKDIQKKEKRKTGTTIIFQNNYKVARPGDVVDVTPADAAKLVAKVGMDE